MRRMISLLLSVILLCATGCKKEDSQMKLQFYYPRTDYGYNAQEEHFFDESVTYEIREDIVYKSARQIIGIYLKGPLDPALANPFPQDLSLVSLSIDGKTLYLTLTDQLSELTGIHLIMACSCLAKTGMVLTRTNETVISCESALLDGKRFIKISENTVIFDDPAIPNTID